MKMYKKHDIFIDLTSLLDVIMILLFMVMSVNTRRAGKLTGAQQEELQNALEVAESRLAAEEFLQEIIDEYSVSLKNTDDMTETLLIFNGNVESIPIPRKKKGSYEKQRRENWNMAVNSLKMDLEKSLQASLSDPDKLIYILFTYDEDSVYNSDFEDIHRVLDQYEVNDTENRVRYRLKNAKETKEIE